MKPHMRSNKSQLRLSYELQCLNTHLQYTLYYILARFMTIISLKGP